MTKVLTVVAHTPAPASSFEVTPIHLVGQLAVHETTNDYRLAESKTKAYTVTHVPSGRSLVAGVVGKKAVLEYADRLARNAAERGLGLLWTDPQEATPAEREWLNWAYELRGELKVRKGFPSTPV